MKKRLFLFFMIVLFILTLAPITGDDWGNFVTNPTGNILSSIKLAYGMYFTWEGRIVSRILIYVLTAHKILWNVITAISLTSIYFIGLKLLGKNSNPSSQNILFIGLLLLNCNMFAQGYNWVAGSITYLYPTAIFIMYFYYIFKKKADLNKLHIILLSLVNIVVPMFVENIGCAFVIGNVLLLGYFFYITKKVNYNMILFCILSGVSILVMLLSPGSALRVAGSSSLYEISIFYGLAVNFYEFIKYSFLFNPVLILLMSIPVAYTLFNKLPIKSRKTRMILIIMWLIIPVLTMIENLTLIMPFRTGIDINLGMFSKYLVLFWITFICLFVYSVYFIYRNNKAKRDHLLILYVASLSSSLIMIFTSNWGERIVLLSVLVSIIISINMIDEFIPNIKFIRILTWILLFGTMLCYSLIMICAGKINKERIEYINTQASQGVKELVVYYNPIRIIWNPNIPDDYFIVTYKEYLGFDDSYSFNVTKLSLKEYIKMVIE